MKTLNPKNDFSFELKNVRELTFDEIELISGGNAMDDDGETHGKGCGCMTCRIKHEKPVT
jgi:hypothetical protein